MTAFRRRVSISAIGSVICFSRGPLAPLLAARLRGPNAPGRSRLTVVLRSLVLQLPAALGHAGHVALQRQLAEAQPAQPELAQVRARPAAQVAAVAQTNLEFRRLVLFRDFCCGGHS